jgi:hypothetical protein
LADRLRPIFVVGFARSGTTLLQALLGAHSRISAPPEVAFFSRIWKHRQYWGELGDDAALRRVLAATIKHPMLNDAGFTVDALYDRMAGTPRRYADVLDAVLCDYAGREGKPRWSEKTPLQQPGVIWHHFPDALIIHIVRDPRETIASNLRLPWETESAAFLARWWFRFTLDTIYKGAERGSAQYLRIRYEDLCRDPYETMRLVCAFVDEPFEPEMVGDTARRRRDFPEASRAYLHGVTQQVEVRPATWRSALSRSDRVRIAQIVSPLLPGLGYELPRRSTLLTGAAINTALQPLDQLARWRERRRISKASPEQRMEAIRAVRLAKKRQIEEQIGNSASESQAQGVAR